MATSETQFCTDEELLQELKKLGYSDVSAEAFLMVKKDLSELIMQEKGVPINSQKYKELTLYKSLKYSNQPQNAKEENPGFLPGRSPTFVIDPDKASPVTQSSSSSYVLDLPQNKVENLKSKKSTQLQNQSLEEKPNYPKFPTGPDLPTSSKVSYTSPRKLLNISRNYESKEKTLFQNTSKEKEPEDLKVPSNSHILKISANKLNYGLKEKSQSLLTEENSKSSTLSSNSQTPKTSPRRYNYSLKEKPEKPKLLIEKNSVKAKLPQSSYVPKSPVNRRRFESFKLKEKPQRPILAKGEQENTEPKYQSSTSSSQTSIQSNLEPNSVFNDHENSNKISQSIAEEDPENTDTNGSDTSKSNESQCSSLSNLSFDEYRERLKTFKAGRQTKSLDSPDKKDSSSVSLEGNKIKRKVLRHKNGKPVVTEEFIEIPSIFNTPTNSDKSSDELSSKANSSSGSLSAASPETSDSPRSTDSLSSNRSVLSRTSMARKKKSDPVAMYHYYKKFWNDFKPPGEKKHDQLRWDHRNRMLEYSL